MTIKPRVSEILVKSILMISKEGLLSLNKCYCLEKNFVLCVEELKRGPGTESKIKKKVREIWE